MPTNEISADWAAQRIKGLSLIEAVCERPLRRPQARSKGEVIKTLIDSFQYPRLGPGQMWEAARDRVRRAGRRGPPRPPGRPDRARRLGRHRVRRPRRARAG